MFSKIQTVLIAVLLLPLIGFAADVKITDRPSKVAITEHVSVVAITDRVESDPRPFVDFYTASWCVNCRVPASILSKSPETLPFRIRKIDVDEIPLPANLPEEEKTIPHFQWKNVAGNDLYTKWKSREDLIGKWKLSTKHETTKAPLSFRNYQARWSYPGSIDQHMRDSHGVTGTYTRAELEEIHDLVHERKPYKHLLKKD